MEKEELTQKVDESLDQTKKSGHDSNRIMGLAAIFISILSMIAVIYQSYLAREENQLMRIQQSASVLPYLDFWYSNVGNEYNFVIENKGVGPAFITDVIFRGIDSNRDTVNFKSSHKLINFISEQSGFLDSIPVVKSSLNANMLLAPNELKTYYSFTLASQNVKTRFNEEFYTYYAGFNIIYQDVYGIQWVLDSKRDYPVKLKLE